MKHTITLSVALPLLLLISLVSVAPTAQAQQAFKLVADTGVLTLRPNQILRVTALRTGDVNNDDRVSLRFGQAAYMALGCNGDGVCKHGLASQSLAAPVMLNPGEAASIDIPNSNAAVRGIVLSTNNVKVNVLIIDSATGNLITTASGSVY